MELCYRWTLFDNDSIFRVMHTCTKLDTGISQHMLLVGFAELPGLEGRCPSS